MGGSSLTFLFQLQSHIYAKFSELVYLYLLTEFSIYFQHCATLYNYDLFFDDQNFISKWPCLSIINTIFGIFILILCGGFLLGLVANGDY